MAYGTSRTVFAASFISPSPWIAYETKLQTEMGIGKKPEEIQLSKNGGSKG